MSRRFGVVRVVIFLFAIGVAVRLFYWQVVRSADLSASAKLQYESVVSIDAPRGLIKTSDGFPLVTNQTVYNLIVDPSKVNNKNPDQAKLSQAISRFLPDRLDDYKASFAQAMGLTNSHWFPLLKDLTPQQAGQFRGLSLPFLKFETGTIRDYPEASMSASLLGFVASDENGNPQGYFGLEGYYDREIRGRGGEIQEEQDASGQPILTADYSLKKALPGKDLVLFLDRGAQYIVQTELAKGLTDYGAADGTVTVMDPYTGGILAMANLPTYDPASFEKADQSLFHNPVVSQNFEPGSIFKPVIMSAAINENAVTPNTVCDRCTGPWQVGQYFVHTWNDKYYPNSTMAQVIQHSDNVGMTFVADRLGHEKILDYLKLFGLGQPTGIDVQDEDSAPLKASWYQIDYDTVAFGQGIAVTPIQMVRAISVIANGGILVKPRVVAKIIDQGKEEPTQEEITGRIISQKTAQMVTDMMVNAVDNGEAKWTAIKGFRIAGKTGTAQIPLGGSYESQKTNASFIGFVPADQPKFVMLVTLHNPSTSPWAAETAAPLWSTIARDLIAYWSIPSR